MVLMAGAGLLGKSLYRLLHTDTGLVADGLLQFGTSWSPGKYKTDREVIALGHKHRRSCLSDSRDYIGGSYDRCANRLRLDDWFLPYHGQPKSR